MTQPVDSDEIVRRAGHCIIGCGWSEPDLQDDHPGYCERTVGSKACAVTEPEWNLTQFWCSVIRNRLDGEFPVSFVRDSEQHRNGIQLAVEVFGDVPVSRPYPSAPYQEVKFNLSSGEARSLAAQLIAAADSSDGIGAYR